MKDYLDNFIINHEDFKQQLSVYSYKKAPTIRTLLHKNFSIEERIALLELYYLQNNGWFVTHRGWGYKLLCLAAIEMNITNAIYCTYDEAAHDEFVKFAESIPDDLSTLICDIYAKQKNSTFVLLSQNHKKHKQIVLYRGVRNVSDIYYSPNCLESYTNRIKVARFYAKDDGIILRRNVSIDDVFVYRTSLYKTTDVPTESIRRNISMAGEYIIENKVDCFQLKPTDDNIVYDVI